MISNPQMLVRGKSRLMEREGQNHFGKARPNKRSQPAVHLTKGVFITDKSA